ncbi:S24 family peptidase [Paenibacillus polymyxa]|uniref:LexA family protein n=1 Tax=Paenibacillus polymyxa TaxID=1406 RepID=UPI000EB93DAF|nr:XRE family transcriptional regulator [Paenibacillus polymyxa]RGL39110.1 XRE family transcriptional regulator [Paenibacillus polymyxa]WHX37358.1 S24 family peptidase [Paenibacillus polymyxa]
MSELHSIGERIKFLRKKNGYTQNQIAEKLGINPANISSYERNQSIPPSDKLAIIADLLNTTTDYLTCRTSESYPLGFIESTGCVKESFHLKNHIHNTPSKLPLVGTICAGDGMIAEENIEGFVNFPLDSTGTPDYALRVQGNSMQGAGILDGDIVYLTKKRWADYNGQIVAAIVGGETGSLKRMKWSEGSPYIKLIPENSDFETKEVLPHEIIVCGVYSGHFRPDYNI